MSNTGQTSPRARPRTVRGLVAAWAVACAAAVAPPPVAAGTVRLCQDSDRLTAAQKDRVLRFAAEVRRTLDASPARVALVARAGLDLERLGQRYSHAGFSLRASTQSPWAVRQLYYDCVGREPQLFDQGLAAFLLGAEQPDEGWLSILLLPDDAAAAVERAVSDNPRSLALLHPRYAANAYAWSTRYQNCNQWVAEMLAAAWGGASTREQAQDWLRGAAYEPTLFEVTSPLVALGAAFVPWLRHDDHPPEDAEALRYRVTMPASIERFVRERLPGTRRVELCHGAEGIVVREGWTPIGRGCRAAPGDRVVPLG